MPYTIGLQAASSAFLTTSLAVYFFVAIIICFAIVFGLAPRPSDELDAPTRLPGFSFFHIFPFFKRRYDFLRWAFEVAGQNTFQFDLLGNTVVVVSGEKARHAFFTAKGLDLTEGFKILSGAIPMVKGVTSDLQMRRISLIHRRLADVQRNASLSALIPLILQDSRKIMKSWGASGHLDPFERFYEVLFRATVRSLSSNELADDTALVGRLKQLYDILDTGTTPATVLLPWLPTPAMLQKLRATKEIYDIVVRAINERVASGIPQADTLQMLLDYGEERLVVVGFIMGLLVAGARATGTTISWMVTFLAGHPNWREKAAAEVEQLLSNNCSLLPSEPLSSRLSSIPLEVWECETPILDAIIRETTRIAQPHTAMRRNIGPQIYIDNKRIPTGSYVVYPFSDVHLDPTLYPDPWKFDPGRKGKEAKSTPFGYVGWGAGSKTCLGTRLAKLELKLVAAMAVLGFHHSIVDSSGKATEVLPSPDWNDILLCRPPRGSFYIHYERTAVLL